MNSIVVGWQNVENVKKDSYWVSHKYTFLTFRFGVTSKSTISAVFGTPRKHIDFSLSYLLSSLVDLCGHNWINDEIIKDFKSIRLWQSCSRSFKKNFTQINMKWCIVMRNICSALFCWCDQFILLCNFPNYFFKKISFCYIILPFYVS